MSNEQKLTTGYVQSIDVLISTDNYVFSDVFISTENQNPICEILQILIMNFLYMK